MTEIVSRIEFEHIRTEYNVYIIGAILFSAMIGNVIGINLR